jgi:hypothetical protein
MRSNLSRAEFVFTFTSSLNTSRATVLVTECFRVCEKSIRNGRFGFSRSRFQAMWGDAKTTRWGPWQLQFAAGADIITEIALRRFNRESLSS